MAKINIGGLLEGTAYGVINEILSGFRSDDGYAKPSRYEVTLHPPSGARGQPAGADTNIMSILMPQKTSEGTTRETSLRCESISFPGRTLDTTGDVNLYGPIKDVVTGYTYGDITGVFQCSNDMRERTFFEHGKDLHLTIELLHLNIMTNIQVLLIYTNLTIIIKKDLVFSY